MWVRIYCAGIFVRSEQARGKFVPARRSLSSARAPAGALVALKRMKQYDAEVNQIFRQMEKIEELKMALQVRLNTLTLTLSFPRPTYISHYLHAAYAPHLL